MLIEDTVIVPNRLLVQVYITTITSVYWVAGAFRLL